MSVLASMNNLPRERRATQPKRRPLSWEGLALERAFHQASIRGREATAVLSHRVNLVFPTMLHLGFLQSHRCLMALWQVFSPKALSKGRKMVGSEQRSAECLGVGVCEKQRFLLAPKSIILTL